MPRSEIHRAAKRIGLEPAESPADELDRTDEELDTLRRIASAAENIFEHYGEVTTDPTTVLVEALGAAAADFAMIGESQAHGTAPAMAFRRAELRCQLAVALFEYRSEFGFPESANEVGVEAGGAS